MLQGIYRNETAKKPQAKHLRDSLLQYYIAKKHKYIHFFLFQPVK